MATELYFDTARLGRMCPGARKAEQDFSKLASQLGSSLYWQRFLTDGHEALPERLGTRVPGLQCWQGVRTLRENLAGFVAAPPAARVLLAGQSPTLITLAGHLLFERCSTVLATDLEWPPYLVVLRQIANKTGRRLRVARVRRLVLEEGIDKHALVRELAAQYRRYQCDGIFLSDITSTGVRMPLAELIQSLRPVRRPNFTVVDGAQALNHRPLRLADLPTDVYLTGTHKWFGGYHPLRVAFVSPSIVDFEMLVRQLIRKQTISDPLFEFCNAVEAGQLKQFGETVNLTALLTAAGALAYWTSRKHTPLERWHNRQRNRRLVTEAVRPYATPAIRESLTSAVALLRPRHRTEHKIDWRYQLAQHRIVASEPLPGLVRLAMPTKPLREQTLTKLRKALGAINGPNRFGSLPEQPIVMDPHCVT